MRGQYVDITIPETGITRSYSMANAPSQSSTLSFIIKTYPDGAFSAKLSNEFAVGDALELNGPFGMSFRNERNEGPMLLVGGGSGMAPLWSILNDVVDNDIQKPVRLYYGARTEKDLFYLDEIAAIGEKLHDFKFVPALSDLAPGEPWEGATGFIHEVLANDFSSEPMVAERESYACGPPPMCDALVPVFQQIGIDADDIHLDKFTPATGA